MYREGIQVISSRMLFRLADAKLLRHGGAKDPYVSMELIVSRVPLIFPHVY